MKKTIILLSLLAAGIGRAAAQQAAETGNAQSDFTQHTSEAFLGYYEHGGLQEKLYLVTDKPYYSAGETIRFSAFLLHSMFFTPLTASSFIYVELISAEGNLVTRLKVRGENGRFDNAMELSPKLAAGRYTLRAYTRYMTNFDDGFLFSKIVEIGNYIDDAVSPHITYTVNKDKSIAARIKFVDDNGNPIASRRVEYSTLINGRSRSFASKTDAQGSLSFKFQPSDDSGDCLTLKIEANNRMLERTVQLPSFSDDFGVKFMPEGGNLISGLSQIIAFKAVGSDGLSAEVEGYVSDASGNRLCDISSRHDGMGIFVFTAYAGETYTATLTSSRGMTKSFTLPQALPSGCSLHIKRAGGNIALMKVSATPDIDISRLAAVIQSRGMVAGVIENLGRITRIPLDKLMSGVAQVAIVDKPTMTVVAERLLFIRNDRFASAEIEPDRKQFSPREKITLDIDVRDSQGRPAVGDFAMTVTDSGVVEHDEKENIYSYMLLNSDLRGQVENPSYYFEDNGSERADNLDLVMLTHGWRRYDLGAVLKGSHPEIRHLAEDTQSITGMVTGVAGKAKKPSVMIFEKDNNSKNRYSGTFPLNASNRFTITGIDSPDTAYYYIQALNKNGHSRSVRVKIDPEIYPSTEIETPRRHYTQDKTSIPEDFLVRQKESYYNDGGMRVIDIDAVVVTAQRVENYSYSTAIDQFNTISTSLANYASIYDALQRFHQLEVIGSSVKARPYRVRFEQQLTEGDTGGNSDAESIVEVEERIPAVFVNGMQTDISSLDAYDIKEVVSLSYVDAADAAFLGGGPDMKYGAIILNVKNINAARQTENLTMAKVLVAGYCKPAEFYAPDYSVIPADKRKDLRSTIAWEPQLRTGADGHARVSFWSADRRNDYDVVLEGVTAEGELCRATCRLKADGR